WSEAQPWVSCRVISEPVERATESSERGNYRPFHGLNNFFCRVTQGSASLHPGLYASACSAGSLNGSSPNGLVVTTPPLRLSARFRWFPISLHLAPDQHVPGFLQQ